jgi:hypothetical protein
VENWSGYCGLQIANCKSQIVRGPTMAFGAFNLQFEIGNLQSHDRFSAPAAPTIVVERQSLRQRKSVHPLARAGPIGIIGGVIERGVPCRTTARGTDQE